MSSHFKGETDIKLTCKWPCSSNQRAVEDGLNKLLSYSKEPQKELQSLSFNFIRKLLGRTVRQWADNSDISRLILWYVLFFNPITLDNLISFFQIVSRLRLIKSTLFIPNEVGVTFIVMGRDRVVSLKLFW